MRKQLLLAVLMVAALAVPSFASVQNIKISGDVDSTYLYRHNFDLGRGQDTSNNRTDDRLQSNFFTQTRLRADADLSDNVSATVGLINERSWNQDDSTTANDSIDLNLAFVTLREMLYSPLTVVVGRQVFSYGNSLIVDATGTNNVGPGASGIKGVAQDLSKQTAMDAIRAILNYDPLKVEFLYSKVSSGSTVSGQPDAARDDVDLYGVNTTYNLGDDMKSVVEAYFFAKKDRGTQESSSSDVGAKSDTVYVPGLRASTNILDGLNVQGEFAWQRGTKVGPSAGASTNTPNQKREAYAAQFIANYSIPVAEEYKPNAQYVYTWVSGDSNPGDTFGQTTQASSNKWTAWDPMFENQGGGRIYNTLFDLTNLHIHSVSLSAKPMEDVTVKGTWSGLWLDQETDCSGGSCDTISLRQPDNTSVSAAATNDTSLGHEFDVEVTYDYTEDVQFGLNLGWFNPGDTFTALNDDVASQAILHGDVAF